MITAPPLGVTNLNSDANSVSFTLTNKDYSITTISNQMTCMVNDDTCPDIVQMKYESGPDSVYVQFTATGRIWIIFIKISTSTTSFFSRNYQPYWEIISINAWSGIVCMKQSFFTESSFGSLFKLFFYKCSTCFLSQDARSDAQKYKCNESRGRGWASVQNTFEFGKKEMFLIKFSKYLFPSFREKCVPRNWE